MILLVGLGNPGKQYFLNRHNIGFWVLNAVRQMHQFPEPAAKFHGLFSKGKFIDKQVGLLWPQTMMNLSGKSVQAAMAFYKITPENLWVVHDELDLEPGRIKTKRGGGDAGHNGLKDITRLIGADYNRIRVGIGHPGDKSRVASYVLQDFPLEEGTRFAELALKLADGLPLMLAAKGH